MIDFKPDFKSNDHPPFFERLASDSRRGLLGMERVAKIALACALANWRGQRQESHHVLLQATNGVAKSTLAENINRALLGPDLVEHYEKHGRRVALRRVQGNPELMPSDLVGGDMLGRDKKLVFKHGPLTATDPPTFLVMADEINRTGPRTMSGWLQAMAEGFCTVRSLALDEPTLRFVPGWVIATQNPAQHVGTYPLPEAAYDRFMVMLIVGMTCELDQMLKLEPKLFKITGRLLEAWARANVPAEVLEQLGALKDLELDRQGFVDKLKPILGESCQRDLPRLLDHSAISDRPSNEPLDAPAFHQMASDLFRERRKELAQAKSEIGQIEFGADVHELIARVCYWTWPLDAVRRLRIGTEELVCPHREVKQAVEPLAQGVSPRAAKALRDLACAIAWAFKQPRVTRELIAEIAEPVLAHRLVLQRSTGAGQEGATEAIVRTIVQRALRS